MSKKKACVNCRCWDDFEDSPEVTERWGPWYSITTKGAAGVCDAAGYPAVLDARRMIKDANNTAFVVDYEQYAARMITTSDFFCSRFEAKK